MRKLFTIPVIMALVIACNETSSDSNGTLGLISGANDLKYEAVAEEYEPAEENTEFGSSTSGYKMGFADAQVNDSYYATSAATGSGSATEVPKTGNIAQMPIPSDRKIIWNGTLIFEVSNTDSATQNINSIVADRGGFISNMNLQTNDYRISNIIQVRIASDQFHDLIEELKGESVKIDKVDIKSRDVTEEFIDIQNRLKTKKQARERYIDILRNKTGDIKDVIEAEEAIRRITEEIEAKEGRLRYLKDRVDLCTLTISIYEVLEQLDQPKADKPGYGDRFMASFNNGWKFIVGFSLLLTTIWPLFALVLGFAIWKRKWVFARFRKKP